MTEDRGGDSLHTRKTDRRNSTSRLESLRRSHPKRLTSKRTACLKLSRGPDFITESVDNENQTCLQNAQGVNKSKYSLVFAVSGA